MKLLIVYGYGGGDDIRHPLLEEDLSRARAIAPTLEIASVFIEDLRPEMLKDAEIIYGRPDPGMLSKAEKLRWLHLTSAGADEFMNPDIYSGGDVILTRTADMAPIPISEHMIMVFLALAHKLGIYVRQQSRGEWIQREVNHELTDSTVVIVGYGAIGHKLAEMLRAFSCRVIGVRRNAGGSDPYAEAVYPSDQMDKALAQADFVANLLPALPSTERLFDAEKFATMKKGCCFCNAGRGSTVDHDALAQAIKSGHLAGAAVDVSPNGHEPLDADSPLWDMPEVIITPHTAGSSIHSVQRAYEGFLKKLSQYVSGEPMEDRLDFLT